MKNGIVYIHSINDYVEVSAPVVCGYKTMILIKQVLLWQYSGALPKEEGFMYLLCPNNVQWHTVHKALFQLYLCIVSAFSIVV